MPAPLVSPQPLRSGPPLPISTIDSGGLSEADIDRFATLFSPATPPATPTRESADELFPTHPTHAAHRRKSTQGSTDSDFGAFISVPPSQDPLAPVYDAALAPAPAPHPSVLGIPTPSHARNHSLVYFGRFTANAKSAAERNKREVLDELLQHQDDPMYFLNTPTTSPTPASVLSPTSSPPPRPSSTSTATHSTNSDPIPIPMSISTDDALAEALASDMTNPKLIRDRSGSVKVAPSPSQSRRPLPPRLSGSASPPSVSSPTGTGSSTSLPTASPPLGTLTTSSTSALTTAANPAQATFSRISSSLVSLLPSGRPRSTAPQSAPTYTAPSSAPSASTSRFHSTFTGTSLTHGSPFGSTPYIPPTGAPGFAGDRAWDRGFSEVLEREEKNGLVDPIGLGISDGTVPMGHGKRTKKGVVLVGRRESTVRVLNEEMADLIRPHLPALTKLPRHWTLLYSLDQHGISLNTLYSRCEPRIPTRACPNPPKGGLLVIKDARDAIFGAWVSEGVRLEKGGYYGSGESFLWRYYPPVDDERQGRLDVYNWTGVNEYVALCETGYLSFGGGDGHYGLYLDASLLDGSSAPCPTFGNPALCTAAEGRDGVTKAKDISFECVGLEVWGIGT